MQSYFSGEGMVPGICHVPEAWLGVTSSYMLGITSSYMLLHS
jgi:hypothetical protein